MELRSKRQYSPGLDSCLTDQSGIRAGSGQSQVLTFRHGPNEKQLSSGTCMMAGSKHQAAAFCIRKQWFSSFYEALMAIWGHTEIVPALTTKCVYNLLYLAFLP